MSQQVVQEAHDGLRGRLVRLEEAAKQEFASTLPSLAVIYVEEPFDRDNFEEVIVNLLDSGVVNFCVTGKDTINVADSIDDIIINGGYEKDGWFKRKSIPTSIHQDENIVDTIQFIDTQVRLRKLNPIVNVIYDKPSDTLSDWKKVLGAV